MAAGGTITAGAFGCGFGFAADRFNVASEFA